MNSILEISFLETKLVLKAAQSAIFMGGKPEETLLKFIKLYWEYYRNTDDICFLEFSFVHMRAYLEAGYAYQAHEAFFTEIAKEEGYAALGDVLREINYKKRSLRLTKGGLDSIIGRGRTYTNYAYFSSREKLLNDMMDKIQNRVTGTYCYYSKRNQRGRLTFLVIYPTEVYLYDNQGALYAIID